MWFDSELAKNVWITNAPGAPPLIYGQMFFPLLAPLEVEAGHKVSVSISATPVGDDYTWTWSGSAFSVSGDVISIPLQSTFFSTVMTADGIHRSALTAVPELNADIERSRDTLASIDGRRSILEIAEVLLDLHRDELVDVEKALEVVRSTLLKNDA